MLEGRGRCSEKVYCYSLVIGKLASSPWRVVYCLYTDENVDIFGWPLIGFSE